jgi:hypothetical protein
MSTMTNRLACRPRRNPAAVAGAQNLQPADGVSAFARDMVCVMSLLSDGMTGIGDTSETGRAFLPGDDT